MKPKSHFHAPRWQNEPNRSNFHTKVGDLVQLNSRKVKKRIRRNSRSYSMDEKESYKTGILLLMNEAD